MDLLVVALKYGALSGALESILEVTGENTVIMSLMNGVDSEELIAEKLHQDFPVAWESTEQWDKEWANDRQWS